jgi:hypothetical protein
MVLNPRIPFILLGISPKISYPQNVKVRGGQVTQAIRGDEARFKINQSPQLSIQICNTFQFQHIGISNLERMFDNAGATHAKGICTNNLLANIQSLNYGE